MLRLTRKENQTWREAAIEQGARFGLDGEVEEAFDGYIASGDDDEEAAFCACYDWDVLDFEGEQA